MDLTYPNPGSTTLRNVLLRVMTKLVRQYEALPKGEAGTLRRAAHEATRAAMRDDSALLAETLRAPTCSVLLGALERSPSGARDELEALDLIVMWELSAASALSRPFEVPRPRRGWPMLPLMRPRVRVDIHPEVSTLHVSPGSVTARGAFGSLALDTAEPRLCASDAFTVSPAYLSLANGVEFALVDNNPRSALRNHPDREGYTFDLGGHDPRVWVERLKAAQAVIETHLPDLYNEMRWLLRLVVPCGYERELHWSTSYRDSIGAVNLTLSPSVLKLAEALVHEYQHNKLLAVSRLSRLLLNDKTERYDSPLREDRRPLLGLLMAVHAFLPVDRMYQAIARAQHPWAKSRDWAKTAAASQRVHQDAAKTLYTHARPSKLGAALFAEMQAMARTLETPA